MKPCQHHRHIQTVSRRQFLHGAGAAAAGLLLAGCQGGAKPTAAVDSSTGIKSTVAIAKAESYEPKLIRKQMEVLLDGIGGLSDVLAHGNRVAIKVNLTGGIQSKGLPGIPETESYLTHPEVVKALCELLRDSGVKDLFIVEAVYEKESWPVYGYDTMAKEIGATLVDLNDPDPYSDFTPTTTSDNPLIYDKLTFNPILNEIDTFISVGKMKCHNTAGVTHSIKNLFGLVPYRFYTLNPGDRYRSGFHGKSNETRKRLPSVIMDLNLARPIHLAIVDGIWTAEAGEGPWIPAMTPIKPNLLFAGKDPVATDAVATACQGYDPTSDYPDEPFVHANNHLNMAAELGMGTNRLEDITVVGAKIDDVKMNFKVSY
jgi:uncharacterized protein (DUF362 family)